MQNAENVTYEITTVDLTYIVNELTRWAGYSLDGADKKKSKMIATETTEDTEDTEAKYSVFSVYSVAETILYIQ